MDLVGGVDLYLLKAGRLERCPEFGFGEGSGDAACPGRHAGLGRFVHVGVGDDVRDREPTAGAQDAGGFGDGLGLIPERLITQLEMTTSTLASWSGMSSR